MWTQYLTAHRGWLTLCWDINKSVPASCAINFHLWQDVNHAINSCVEMWTQYLSDHRGQPTLCCDINKSVPASHAINSCVEMWTQYLPALESMVLPLHYRGDINKSVLASHVINSCVEMWTQYLPHHQGWPTLCCDINKSVPASRVINSHLCQDVNPAINSCLCWDVNHMINSRVEMWTQYLPDHQGRPTLCCDINKSVPASRAINSHLCWDVNPVPASPVVEVT